ncbi:nucleoid-associated protein, partial [Morganella morganii]
SSHYGIFNLDEKRRGPFPAEFDKYRNDTSKTLDDELFIGLSKNIMYQLYSEAKDRPAASGGLLLFADYIIKSTRYFLIAMIKQKEGIVISDKLEPKELEHLDLAKLNQAARINYDLYDKYLSADENERQDVNYLSFVSPSSNQTIS